MTRLALAARGGPRAAVATLALVGIVGPVAACEESVGPPTVVFDTPADASWTQRTPPPPAPVGALVLVTNNFDDDVSYIDLGLDPPAEIGRVPVGLNPVEREGPHHLSFSPDGDTVWVGISNFVPGSGSGPHGAHGAGTADGYALELRVADGVELGSVRVDPNPGDIRVSPDGRWVLLSHFDLLRITSATPTTPPADLYSRLAIIDRVGVERAAMVPTCPAAHGIAIAPDSATAFVACWDDHLAVVDLASSEHPVDLVTVMPLPGTIANPECQPYALTQSPSGDTVWVGCYANGELRAYDVASHSMDPARVVDLGGAALFGAYLDADTLVVPSQAPDQLTWLDAATADVEQVMPLDPADCFRAHVVTRAPDGKNLLLVCEGDRVGPGTFVIIDAATRTVSHVIPVGRFPDDIALRPARTP
ncbi:MAG: hypothetical protein U1F43_14810 [Myxococcota bacterium]